ncbi:MAG: phenylacetate--CoA ligase family protein [Armatimonadota bacterium]
MNPWLVRHVVHPYLQRRQESRARQLLAELEQSQWYPAERLREIQWRKLHSLLVHAYTHVPYYRTVFHDLGARPEDFRGLDDMRRFPVLSKEIVRDRGKELMADGPAKLTRRVTSGSTGIPLQTYIDAQSRDWLWATVRRGRRWWGLDVGDRYARVTTAQPSKRQRIRLSLLNERFFSCVDLSEAAMDRLYRQLVRFQPACVRGNPHALAHFAGYVSTRGHVALRPRVIICSAETLYPHQRATLRRTFNCRVGNEYGSNENGLIATQCPAGRMHVNAESVFVESQSSTTRGQEIEELIVTDLNNLGMPLIRYAIGDVGAVLEGRCPCGRGLPLLDLTAGRTGDLVVLPGGRYLDHAVLCTIFEEIGSGRVRQYHIIQEAPEKFTVLLVAPDHDEGVSEAIRNGFSSVLGIRPSVDVRVVPEIPREASGKLRLFVSRVAQPGAAHFDHAPSPARH